MPGPAGDGAHVPESNEIVTGECAPDLGLALMAVRLEVHRDTFVEPRGNPRTPAARVERLINHQVGQLVDEAVMIQASQYQCTVVAQRKSSV